MTAWYELMNWDLFCDWFGFEPDPKIFSVPEDIQ